MFFKIENLNVSIDNKKILNDYNLEVNQGEIHAIMGPNGSGKSTLSKTIMGSNEYQVLSGNIYFEDENINNLKTDERARKGIFLSMQNPITVDGVSNLDFLRTALGSKQDGHVNLYDFMNKIESGVSELKMDQKMMHRSVNAGFSGGEKKKNEVLQMKILEPKLIILDEMDSGLDVDSLKIVCENINLYKKEHPNCAILIITHYNRILDYMKPDFVHVMTCGKIIKSGDASLALMVESKGYEEIKEMGNDE